LFKAVPQHPITSDHWRRLDEARETVDLIGREVLAYVECRLLAEMELDGGAAAAAERLVASLTNRAGIDRPALLGTGDVECIDHTASVVHFRPLGTTVWQLPVIAHELGHHVAASLADRELASIRPVQVWVAKTSQKESDESGVDFRQAGAWLHELFADVFATYALGTAYPLSVMAIRVPYDRVAVVSKTHPPWSRRVATMIAALGAMSRLDVDQTNANTYRESCRWLAARWASLSPAQPGLDTTADRVRADATEMVELLAKHALPRLCYDVTGPVDRLREELDVPDVPPPPGATPAHILNAAWTWRLGPGGTDAGDPTVSARALARCALATL
jgi:hypothetical protein